jgi:hypothetical protein
MPGFDSVTDVVGVPIWMIGFFALVIVVLLAIAIARVGSRHTFGFFAQVAASLVLVAIAWFYFDRLGEQDRSEYRRNIEARLSALNAQALLPHSNLACLDAGIGDAVQDACEKVLYSSPEQVSAALSFVGARLDILRDIAALPDSDEAAYDKLRAPLVRSIQDDRYGLVAQVLQGRDLCTPDKCHAFEFLTNRDRIVVNMTQHAYEERVTRYALGWSDKPGSPAVAAAAPPPLVPPSPAKEPSQLPVNFPSAASIPPVSIMANEPGMPGQNGVDAPQKSEAKQPPSPPRRPAQKAAAQPQPRPQARPQPPEPQQAQPFPQPFPQPVAPAVQTSGAPTSIQPQ